MAWKALSVGASLAGTVAADVMLSVPEIQFALPPQIDPVQVSKTFDVAPDNSAWLLVPRAGEGQALTEQVCTSASACTCTSSSNAQFLAVTCAQPALEAVLLEHGHLVQLLEPDLKVALKLPSVGAPVKAQDWYDDHFPCSGQWGLKRIGAREAANRGRGVHIYVLDTGVTHTHSDFGGRAIPTKDYTGTGCCADGHGHGTHTTGTAIGSTYGVATDATAHAIKVLNDDGSGALSWTLQGVDYVANHGISPRIASMSIDLPEKSWILDNAVGHATDNGVTVVVAAGNEHKEAINISPADAPTAITVGATDNHDNEASYSNYGTAVNIFAPGSYIRSASNTGSGDACMSGTSMATPHVSGAAAMILEMHPDWHWNEVLRQLQITAEKGVVHHTHTNDPQDFLNVRQSRTFTETEHSEDGFSMSGAKVSIMVAAMASGFLLTLVAFKGVARCRSRRAGARQMEMSSPTERPEVPDTERRDAELAA